MNLQSQVQVVNKQWESRHQEEIEKILENCYDLQVLYLIKHLEVIALFKSINEI